MKLLAPLSGPVLPIESVPDPVFSGKMVGPGIAIDPVSTVLLAPCDGVVKQIHRARHAVTVTAPGGVDILLHLGLDTVKLNGLGLNVKVKEGQSVRAGAELIAFDADVLATQAKSLITVMIITEVPESRLRFTSATHVRAGQDVLVEVQSAAASEAPQAAAGESVTSRLIKVDLETGLHARPAAQLAALAKSYSSEVELSKGSQSANAKSVVAVMGLEIAKGDQVRFSARGADAGKAVEELSEYLSDLREEPAAPAPQKPATRTDRPAEKDVLYGVGVSPGLAIGRIYQIRSVDIAFAEKSSTTPDLEQSKLQAALKAARRELEELTKNVKAKTDAAQAAIFSAHQELLEDPELVESANRDIAAGKTAGFAWQQSIQSHATRLASLNNELLANRANDLRDVGRRVARLLSDERNQSAAPLIPNDSILIAENLTPSETALLDRTRVLGFCTTGGGATSHVAILARSLGLPAMAGGDAKLLALANGTEVILDGEHGELRLHPNAEAKQTAQRAQNEQHERRKAALSLAHRPALTRDGQAIEVGANIGSVADAMQAVELGADGVGLLRSEFLFLERDTAPTEDEQLAVYQAIADTLGARPLVIRTLDVGGDKPLRYLPLPPEENPFLGVRGVRVGFRHPEIFRQQLRAILRVKSAGKLHVMFPMVATIEDFRQAKAMLEEERAKLNAPRLSVGIMVEVPSVAISADIFAREADFFSIGTNDLTQYVLAMDRGHSELATQVDGLHPSVLKLIELSVQAAHRHGKWVGVCGGLASDLKAVPLLIGLGVDELSVSIPTVPLVKSQVRESSKQEARDLAIAALSLSSALEVRELKKNESLYQGLNHVHDESIVLLPAEDR